MVKHSSSKRAYKKRRTVRKSRVIRRRKTARSKTLRGGKLGDTFKEFAGTVGEGFGSLKRKGAEYFGKSSAQSPDQAIEQTGPSAEENKAALKAANIEANTAYDAAKQNRDEAKKNFGKGPNLDNAQAAASAAYEVALNAANAAKDGGVPENEVKYPKT